ncbi:MAG: TRAM domain-containing protein [Candidatus Omnitrophota bacterium]|jgi:uncharacterized protein YacL|nr:MAG: TRAM domain-containing protein [Candidatus Omnitrophota bacterium]
MKAKKQTGAENGVPFLRVVRLLFIILTTFLVHKWAQTINPHIQQEDLIYYSLCGMLVAFVLVFIESCIRYAFPQELFVGLFGLICGLSTSALIQLALPESLPQETKIVTRLGLHLFLGYFGMVIALRYAHRFDFSATKLLARSEDRLYGCKILDTSVLIDGRIVEIADVGFLEGLIVIPSFVINELQTLSDSQNHLKRSKGRRGLDISKRLQSSTRCEVEILEVDFSDEDGVDKKLLALAKKYDGSIVTMDFNLHKVAEIDELSVMNINQLAQSVKMVVLPGENLQVQILREGKEAKQGIAYLDDGTMIVIENGKKLLGKQVEVTVVSILQTSAGRMVFTKLNEPAEIEDKNNS